MIENGSMVAIVMALSEMVKQLHIVGSRYIPVITLILGVGICLVYEQGNLSERVFKGIVVGLCASGLFSGSKRLVQGEKGGKA